MKQTLAYVTALVLLAACGAQTTAEIEPAELAALGAETIEATAEPAMLTPAEQAAENADANLAALTAYRARIEQVYTSTGAYPMTKRSFRSALNALNEDAGDDVELGLPEGIALKRDGRIVYRSDGADYKLIAQRTGDCGVVRATSPGMIDPKRDYGPGDCIAYGYWTEGAADW